MEIISTNNLIKDNWYFIPIYRYNGYMAQYKKLSDFGDPIFNELPSELHPGSLANNTYEIVKRIDKYNPIYDFGKITPIKIKYKELEKFHKLYIYEICSFYIINDLRGRIISNICEDWVLNIYSVKPDTIIYIIGNNQSYKEIIIEI